jgi:hypothetical protein
MLTFSMVIVVQQYFSQKKEGDFLLMWLQKNHTIYTPQRWKWVIKDVHCSFLLLFFPSQMSLQWLPNECK